jgi:hypothetical protein
LTGRRQLQLKKEGWLRSRFALTDAPGGRLLAEAERGGLFTSAWDIRLSIGQARLVSVGWFNSAFRVILGGQERAAINRVGACGFGWAIRDDGSLQDTDLLFIGLIYHTILKRATSAE